MKLLLALLVLLLSAGGAWATGETTTVGTPTTIKVGDSKRVIVPVTILAASNNGAIASATLTATSLGIDGMYMYTCETDPGSTSPTDAYGLTIKDANGYDLAGGLLANRSESATQLVNFGTASHGFPIVRGDLTLAGTGNSKNSATVVLYLTFIEN